MTAHEHKESSCQQSANSKFNVLICVLFLFVHLKNKVCVIACFITYLFICSRQKDCSDSKHRRKKRKIALKPDIEKNSKKSSKKKKKKKKRKRTVGSGSESCSDAEDSGRRERSKKAGKNKHRKKKHKSKERTEDSSTEDSRLEKRLKTRRKRDCLESDTLSEPRTKKRKNWRVGKDERSEESSDGWAASLTRVTEITFLMCSFIFGWLRSCLVSGVWFIYLAQQKLDFLSCLQPKLFDDMFC